MNEELYGKKTNYVNILETLSFSYNFFHKRVFYVYFSRVKMLFVLVISDLQLTC